METEFVFVYGTLKRGHYNHPLINGSRFLGEAKTFNEYPLHIDGLPYLLDRRGEGYRVKGELYEVSERTLARLDRLEGHPRHYRRRWTKIQLTRGAVQAWVYFLTPGNQADTLISLGTPVPAFETNQRQPLFVS